MNDDDSMDAPGVGLLCGLFIVFFPALNDWNFELTGQPLLEASPFQGTWIKVDAHGCLSLSCQTSGDAQRYFLADEWHTRLCFLIFVMPNSLRARAFDFQAVYVVGQRMIISNIVDTVLCEPELCILYFDASTQRSFPISSDNAVLSTPASSYYLY